MFLQCSDTDGWVAERLGLQKQHISTINEGYLLSGPGLTSKNSIRQKWRKHVWSVKSIFWLTTHYLTYSYTHNGNWCQKCRRPWQAPERTHNTQKVYTNCHSGSMNNWANQGTFVVTAILQPWIIHINLFNWYFLLRKWKFHCPKVLLPVCPCWWQPAYWDLCRTANMAAV